MRPRGASLPAAFEADAAKGGRIAAVEPAPFLEATPAGGGAAAALEVPTLPPVESTRRRAVVARR